MHGFTRPPAAPSQAFWPINLSQGLPSLMGVARRAAHLVAPTPHNRDMAMSQCFKKLLKRHACDPYKIKWACKSLSVNSS